MMESLLECQVADLMRREQAFIDAYFDHDQPLYNLRPNADPRSTFRFTHTHETIERLIVVGKRMTFSPEHRAKISVGLMGRVLTPESRAKMSAIARNRSPEVRALMGVCNIGRKHTKEFCDAISARFKGKAKSPETRARMKMAQRGHPVSLAQRAKISAILKGRILPVETRLKMSAARRSPSPERRAQLSEIMKARWAKKKAGLA
jgi:hypothetical protein